MNKLLKNKLNRLLKDLADERRELKNIFFKCDTKILSRKSDEILRDYKLEQDILKKYEKNTSEMVNYIVKLDFALRDLMFILR